MKCEIRTVIDLDDQDLINLIEKCKEKHKLAELIGRALNAYCYQSDKVPESRREVTGADDVDGNGAVPEAVARDLRSLTMQMAVLLNNVQSNHSYTMEAFGRLSSEVNSIGRHAVVVPEQSPPFVAGTGTELAVAEKVNEEEVEKVIQESRPSKPIQLVEEKVDTNSEKFEETVPKPKQVVEETVVQKAETNNVDDDDDEEEGLSADAAAALAAFLGGGG